MRTPAGARRVTRRVKFLVADAIGEGPRKPRSHRLARYGEGARLSTAGPVG